MKVLDLTHPISGDLPVYFPWHPKTELEQTATYRDNKCEVRRLTVGTHSGTHIDAPSHVLEGQPTLDQYDPSLWYIDVQVLDFTPRMPSKAITREEISEKFRTKGTGVLIKTGWDVQFGKEDYYRTYPPLSNGAAEYLVEMKIPVLAADTPFTLDVHYIILKHGIPLITNVNNTARLKEGLIKLIAAPLLIQGADGAPARVLAVIEENLIMDPVVSLLADLVAIPSMNPMGRGRSGQHYSEQPIAEFILSYLKRNAIDAELQPGIPGRPNVVGRISVGAPQTILLEAHLDTVQADSMTMKPFDPVVRDGRLFGRGSCDTKGSIAAFLHTVTNIIKEAARLRYNILLLFVSDEEYRFTGAQHAVKKGLQADFGIVGEPTCLRICTDAQGSHSLENSYEGGRCAFCLS